MTEREHCWQTWASSASRWSSWAKPVLFAHMDARALAGEMPVPDPIPSFPQADGTTAIVIDLPGVLSVATVPGLLATGHRPVPLFNALPGPRAEGRTSAEVWPIVDALAAMTSVLNDAKLPDDAPPAFLLDSDRRHGVHRVLHPGVFDNRSISLPTDFPSAGFLLDAGIRSVLLVLPADIPPQADLSHTLRRWQLAGIPISRATPETAVATVIDVRPPSRFRSFWYSLGAVIGLRPHLLGGFGGTLPIPSAG
jgi:hypothetical protein